MGMPQTVVNFLVDLGQGFILRTENGIVALIIKDNAAVKDLFVYGTYDEVRTADGWTDASKKYIEMAFMSNPRPKKVYVAKVGTTTPTLALALQALGNRRWNYLAYPAAVTQDTTDIVAWIKSRRNVDYKTYKAVIADNVANDEGIINFTTDEIAVGAAKYTTEQFTSRIAGLAAGVGITSSLTNYTLEEVDSVKDLDNDTARNAAIDAGQLILVNNGEEVVIARGVNSKTTTSSPREAMFKKIRIIEIKDQMRDDITTTINKAYKGKVINIYDNKMILVGAINNYFRSLEAQSALDPSFNNICEIDVPAQKEYLRTLGVAVDSLTDQQIKEYNTDDKVFLRCAGRITDAAEDFTINFYL